MPERDREYFDAVHGKHVQGGTGPHNIRDGIVSPHFVEVSRGTVHLLFRCMDPLKDPAGHRKRRCRDRGGGHVKAFHHLFKGPVRWCRFRIYLNGVDTRPGDAADRGLCYHCRHCTHDRFPVCPAVQEGTRDHVARCTVEGIENENPHYQYL